MTERGRVFMNGRVLRLCDESSRNLAVGAVSLSSRTNRNGTTYLLKSPKGRLLYFGIRNDGSRVDMHPEVPLYSKKWGMREDVR